MYENNFKRIEQKYLLTEKEYKSLLKKINKYLDKDAYFESNIYNIYFDTPNNDLIVNSIEKPRFKHKVRLRSYNIPTLDDDVFLEIKMKYKKIVSKRRIKIKLSEFYKYYNDNVLPNDSQIMKELDYLFKLYKLEPSYYLSYNRYSYRSKEDSNLRITFDYDLKYRKDNLFLDKIEDDIQYFKDKMYIMEIKALGSLPLWLVRELSYLKIYRRSFSKIGNIYIKEKENKIC